MCGICGFSCGQDDQALDEGALERMVECLRHRGPDDQGFYRQDGVALGHDRLSIIDLEGGRQPIASEDEAVSVISNGEIYNFAELAADLKARGHRFRTRSDSEVIVHLWEDEGPECVQKLRGMFAFVLHDRRRGALFGARDRFGQKPLFYHHDVDRGRFAFASEIKALLSLPWISRRLDAVGLDQFLFYQFVPHPRTLLEGVRQLPPAHTFLLENGRLRLDRYWRPSFEPRPDLPDDHHLQRLRKSVCEAVESHLVSDVPVGIFLSGGIDSSLVAAIATRVSGRRLSSFSIGFPGERQDESSFARLASRHAGTDHREFPFRPGHIEERLEALARTLDQPLADPAALPLAYLSEHASREIKVVFTGDGGDELFAGYEKYFKGVRAPRWLSWIDRRIPALFSASRLATCGPDPGGLRKLRSRIAFRALPVQECIYYKNFWEAWDRDRLYGDDLRQGLGERFEGLDVRLAGETGVGGLHPVDRMLLADQIGYLPDDLLRKTDLATMAWGLEARAPLLDHHLAAVAGSLPARLKTTGRETKVALRRIAEHWLPPELVRRPKRGFSVPLAEWFRGGLRGWVRECLLDSSATLGTCFRREGVERVLGEHESGHRNRASKIYALLFFELWYRHYLA
ncbi:MAG: asparagine synthase (glutamine-hydrolyzing) [Planctomycetota bacterium]